MAFGTISAQSHPLTSTRPLTQEKTEVFKQLTEAYNVLSNTERRQKYDSTMGISRVNSFYDNGPEPGSAASRAADDVRAPPPPPGFKVIAFHSDRQMWPGSGDRISRRKRAATRHVYGVWSPSPV